VLEAQLQARLRGRRSAATAYGAARHALTTPRRASQAALQHERQLRASVLQCAREACERLPAATAGAFARRVWTATLLAVR
jgi:hypothetical protein